jgi:hypothetical protein
MAPPAQAICLASLYIEGVTFADGQEIYDAQKQLGRPDTRTLLYIAYLSAGA